MQGLRWQTGLGSPPCSGPGRGLPTSAGDRQLPHPRRGRHQAEDSAQGCTLSWEPTAGAQLGLKDVHRVLPPSHAHTRPHAHAPGEQSGPSPDWACRSGGCLQEAPAWPWGEASRCSGREGGRCRGGGKGPAQVITPESLGPFPPPSPQAEGGWPSGRVAAQGWLGLVILGWRPLAVAPAAGGSTGLRPLCSSRVFSPSPGSRGVQVGALVSFGFAALVQEPGERGRGEQGGPGGHCEPGQGWHSREKEAQTWVSV